MATVRADNSPVSAEVVVSDQLNLGDLVLPSLTMSPAVLSISPSFRHMDALLRCLERSVIPRDISRRRDGRVRHGRAPLPPSRYQSALMRKICM